MGLQSKVQIAVGRAFDNSLSDAVRAIEVVDISDSVYDTDTGVVTPVESRYPTRAVIEPYSEVEVGNSGGAITETDFKLTVLQNEVGAVINPDMLVSIDGRERRIMSLQTDPASATYTIQVKGS